jgi:PAS domain S-box-containing protein
VQSGRRLPIADAAPADHEARSSAIVASSRTPFFEGPDGTIRSWNSAAERLYGYTADEVIGRNIALIVPDELAGEVGEILREISANRSVEQYETRRRRKDGTLVDVLLSVSPVHGAGGRVIAASVISRDVSRRRAAEALRGERRLRSRHNFRARSWSGFRRHRAHDDTVQPRPRRLRARPGALTPAREPTIESAVTLTRNARGGDGAPPPLLE